MKRLILLASFVAFMLLAAPASAKDYARMARNVIPSGQFGGLPIPARGDRQALMYDGLTPLFDRVSRNDLFRFFKSERLGTANQGPLATEPVPRAGLRIVRDRFHVPHIYGRTTDDVTFGAGWVTAEDRELLLEQARFNTRVAAVDVPSLKAFDLVRNLQNFTPSAQTEREVAKQSGVLRRTGRKGRRLLHDIDVYVSGINAYYASKGKTYKRWTRNDIFSLNALKGQFLGEGGGGEVRSAQLLWSLEQRLGARRGESVWNDLRQRQDPETDVSVDGRFPYARLPRRRRGNVIIQTDTFEPSVRVSSAGSSPVGPPQASNILMVSGHRSTNGRPLFVGGPQIGYFYPGLTLEMDLHGPGIHVRGASSVPFPGYMLIGRGEDFGWTLTSAGADIIDTYVETLCGGSDLKYLYKGRCRDMERFDAGSLNGKEIVFYRTVHGPVTGYAKTNHGRRVALARKRSSYGRDTLDQLFFQDLARGRVHNVRQFFKAANQTPQTFNSFYADGRDIGMFTTGRLPLRAPGIDSGLPTDGRGRYEWRGFLSRRRHPQGVNPRAGFLTNWNNKPARGFPAADNEFAYGSIQRDELLKRGLRKHRRNSLATVTGAMNAAATQDVRAVEFVPLLAAVLHRGTAPNARAARMLQLLEAWHDHGGSRLDRDLDGKIDDPGAAVLDYSWDGLANAALSPLLGPLVDQLNVLQPRFDLPPKGQKPGWHQYMDKDLRRLLGRRVRGPLHNRYCGRGNLADCTRDLWAALDAGGRLLAATQGPSPDAWRSDATRERISFAPGLLTTTMRYTNRPSGIQQVLSFKGHRRARR